MSHLDTSNQKTYLLYDGILGYARMHYFRRVVRTASLTPGAKMLDYGCGPGDMLLVAKEFGLVAHGVDNFERSVNMAKARGLNVVLADSSSLPFEKQYFDIIFCQSVLEHVPNAVQLVQELVQHLKPNGLLVLSSPTPGAHFWDDPTHVRPFTPKSFFTLADICKLKTIEVSYVFAFLLGLKLRNSIFYKVLNTIPTSLGSNIIGFFKKNEERANNP